MTAPALSPAALADACARWGVSALDAPKAIERVIQQGELTVLSDSTLRFRLPHSPQVRREVLVRQGSVVAVQTARTRSHKRKVKRGQAQEVTG